MGKLGRSGFTYMLEGPKPSPLTKSTLEPFWRRPPLSSRLMCFYPRLLSTMGLVAGLLMTVLGVALLLVNCGTNQQTWPRQMEGRGAKDMRFVGNQDCTECHEQQFEEWSGSHHDWAMRHANETSVLGDFENSTLTHFGVTSRFFSAGGKYYVSTEGPDGELTDYEIKYTFGVDPLQQYLIEFPGGRLQSLTIAWDVRDRRWFHLYPDERITADDPLHWTGRYQTWNVMCAECHSTNLHKNYDSKTDSYQTSWSEINVSCEACHGPAEEHVAWARAIPPGSVPEPGDHQLVVDFKATDPQYEVDNCARCHSRRHQVSPSDQHGRPLLDDFLVAPLREGLYHADGQILDEVYVYGSFTQSRMYREGVRCSDCHNSHSLELRRPGNDLCVRCHQTAPPEDFPNLQAKNYDTPRHHFHPAASKGAACVECHMRARTYMVVDPRRDHSFRIPRPDLSVTLNTPNACNACHEDQTAQWAAARVKEWYGSKRQSEPHFAEAIAAGRSGHKDAPEKLIQLAKDTDQPSIARATALELLRNYPPEHLPAIVSLTLDEDPLIRTNVAAALQGLPPNLRVTALAPLLQDPVRAVRIEAARVLAWVPRALLNSSRRSQFDVAFGEFEEVQVAMADTPGANLTLGATYAALGDSDRAEQHYATALELDPGFLPAQLNLSTLYNQIGRNSDAERVLREAANSSPDEGEVHYSLGLLLAEENRLEEAAASLKKAVELLPGRARVRYNYALSLQQLGRRPQAEAQLLKTYDLDPSDPDILNAVTTYYLQQADFRKALPYAEQLAQLVPEAPGPKRLVRGIRDRVNAPKNVR